MPELEMLPSWAGRVDPTTVEPASVGATGQAGDGRVEVDTAIDPDPGADGHGTNGHEAIDRTLTIEIDTNADAPEPVTDEAVPIDDVTLVDEAVPVDDVTLVDEAVPVDDVTLVDEAVPVDDVTLVDEAVPVDDVAPGGGEPVDAQADRAVTRDLRSPTDPPQRTRSRLLLTLWAVLAIAAGVVAGYLYTLVWVG